MLKDKTENGAFFVGFNDKQWIDGDGWISPESWDFIRRPWYIQCKESKDTVLSEPYYTPSSNRTVITASKRIRKNGEMISVLGTDIDFEAVQDIINNVKFKKTGRAFLINKSGKIIIHHDYEIDSDIRTVDNEKFFSFADELLNSENTFFTSSITEKSMIYVKTPINRTQWYVVLTVPKSELISESRAFATFMFILSFITVLLMAIAVYTVSLKI